MKKLIALLAVLCVFLGCLAGCDGGPATTEPTGNVSTEPTGGDSTTPVETVDYAGSITLDMDSETAKLEVNVKAFIDGDTTHFFVPEEVMPGGILKGRYLAVNTPESTGKIEVWGKKASSFTRSKLEGADSIIIESDTDKWNADSTGGRYMVWVWYRTAGTDTYRNLNIEILQNGLAIASNSAENRYGETCVAALNQAKTQKLHVHGKEVDPDFYYGDAIPVTLKGLRTNVELYHNMKVAFEGVITRESGQTVYVEEYDPETDTYFGMSVYYGYNLTGTGLSILEPGNRVAFVGSVQYYEEGGTWQVSDIKYVDMRPNDPNNIQLISEGNEAANRLLTAEQFLDGKVTAEINLSVDGEATTMKTFDFAETALSTSVSFENLKVGSIYTTTNQESASKGAMTLTCYAGDRVINVRTVVLRDENGDVITASAYQGKTINVKGIVDYFSGDYQIKVFSPEDITIVG